MVKRRFPDDGGQAIPFGMKVPERQPAGTRGVGRDDRGARLPGGVDQGASGGERASAGVELAEPQPDKPAQNAVPVSAVSSGSSE
jgi:hypothetical protein